MAKINRTRNATRNIFFGVILQVYKLFVPFLMRTALIYLMGVQYLGLNSLFASILQVLNMAELGIGSAMVYSMYQPIAEDDTATVCALMKLYRRYYRIIGLAIATVGILITPFIPKLISGSVPADINIYILYYLDLGATVLSYWLFAYKNSLLLAHQRTDVTSKITLLTSTLQYGAQFAVLLFFKNYYYYVIVVLLTQALTNIVTAIYADKMFPLYKPSGDLDKQNVKKINQRIKDLFSAKLGTVLGTSVDTIVISANLGLTALAIYQNYYYIMNSVIGFILIIFASVRAGIGNSLVVEGEEKNYNDFKKLGFITLWITTISISCFITMYQPFMKIWVGEELLLPYFMVILFCIYFFLVVMQNLACTYKDASGIWHEDRFRPLITGVVNLILNILLVRKWGLSGVLLSTIISYLFIATPWVIINLFKLVFKRSAKEYVFQTVNGFIIAMVISLLCYFVCSFVLLDGFLGLIVRLVISLVISNGILVLVHKKNSLFLQITAMIKRIVFRR